MRELCHGLGQLAAGRGLDQGLLGVLFGSLLTLVLVLLVGEFLWNKVLCKLVTVAKPVTSIWQLLGLMVLFNILF
jgi:hypothetical protein|tara:strand:+ start:2251 stop:2475 length:225 start_codon:yes stop_codon:yes gene_type:complete